MPFWQKCNKARYNEITTQYWVGRSAISGLKNNEQQIVASMEKNGNLIRKQNKILFVALRRTKYNHKHKLTKVFIEARH